MAVSVSGLERAFGAVKAVDGVDLEVAEGEIYGFLGPNGAGKSTTVRMLCTLLRPTGGRARVAGYDIVTQAEHVRLAIGVALQDSAVDPKLSGRETLQLQGRYYGLDARTVAGRIEELEGLLDLGPALDRRVGTYSGGMRRRLDLAAALVHRPAVLFLDEPTTGLDPVSRATVWDEVRQLNAGGMTIFLTTQYLEEADVLADRVGIIDGGRLVAEDTPVALKRQVGRDVVVVNLADPATAETAHQAVTVLPDVEGVDVLDGELTVAVSDGAAAVAPLAVALEACGVRVRDLTLRTPTLDDVFLELTGNRIVTEEPS